MTASPRVSIGIPTYNRPEGLRRTLACMTRQTYRNVEIIVSDNCSPGKETERVVRDFTSSDDRVRYFVQETNRGAISNFKSVLDRSTGKYFMWVADDDAWDPEAVAAFVECLENRPGCSVAMSACRRIYEATGACETIDRFGTGFDLDVTAPIRLAWNACVNHYWTYLIYGMFHAPFLKQTFARLPEVFGSDVLFVCEVLLSSRIQYLAQPFYARTVSRLPTVDLYHGEKIAELYRDRGKYYKLALNAGRYLLKSKAIPGRRKWAVPFLMGRMALFAAQIDLRKP